MIHKVLTKVFGTKGDRDIREMQPIVEAINALEPEMKAKSDDQLGAVTLELKEELAQGKALDDILPRGFAAAREAAVRTLGMRPFDVQLIGGIVLHRGKISEMKTGEGKTLMATMPVYLNALAGKGVHVVTVNDYLARRDAEWMGIIYRFLGLSVGIIQHDMPDTERKAAYAADVTYGTNNELGFDYLRDNMKFDLASMVQRGHHYAIVDEVDSILIDEARTPLIISGPSEEATDRYYRVDKIVPKLEQGEEIEESDGSKSTTGDFLVDEKAHTVAITDDGVTKVERMLGVENLYDLENMELLAAVNQALRAHALFKRDVDYLVKDGKVVIVDEFTGRMMPGRRWSDGLHQAVEAKEGVTIERENQTLATITFQNYFRMYEKLAGMTGTADTEAAEFGEIYKLDVVVVPTNKPMIRDDRADLVYRTAEEKWEAVVEEIKDDHQRGQPVLVGTVSIEKSEMLGKMLKRAAVPHVVLNAKFHEREASIVAQAGRKGAVTIATNMAGRGTDIVLGGNPAGLARTEADAEAEKEAYEQALERFRVICAPREGGGARRRRPAHPRHRTARVAAHRQPAARPLRPSGGPRILALLPLPRGRPHAHLRRRSGEEPDGPPGHGAGRADRAPHGHARHQAGPGAGRGSQLRVAQAPARVRRRDEQAARGDLQPAQRDPARRGGQGLRPRARRGRHRLRRRHPLRRQARPAGLGPRGARHRHARLLRPAGRPAR